MSVNILCPFFSLGCLLLSCEFFAYCGQTQVPYQKYDLQTFSPIWVVFHFLDSIVCSMCCYHSSVSPFAANALFLSLTLLAYLFIYLLALIFGSMNHFDFCVWCEVRAPTWFFCRWIGSWPNTTGWKKFFFSNWMVLIPCWKSIDPKWKGLFLDPQFHSIDLYAGPYASTMLTWLPKLCSKFWNPIAGVR